MTRITAQEKYAQTEVIDCWKNLSRAGLQQAEAEMVNRYFPRQGRLLDVGCGTGRAVIALSQLGYQVVGIDLSLPMLLAGRELSDQAQLGTANLLHLPFQNQPFDAILMLFGALQHIPGRQQRQQALAELRRIVRPEGRLVIGLDNLAPALTCYFYWLGGKLTGTSAENSRPAQPTTVADSTLWSRETRRVNPLIWHARGVARSLRWRTWPGFIDRLRQSGLWSDQAEPGDRYVAQFSLQTTTGQIYYHCYQAEELIDDAAQAGWRLLGFHSGTELAENRLDPLPLRRGDKQLFFAFEPV
jgi:SAM-dependent methyltransferase